ncbi:hypothetical protein GCM10007924_19600 [Sneathiella chinensis]|uniref:Uncharacterized protein n=1 Tax=Sneathiella chinensis TaxID=349750 RepID=A0ABQ5U3L1_9PROT|nr:hypothetical protein GCM10007924_19600 [Sneathiella chinensis]
MTPPPGLNLYGMNGIAPEYLSSDDLEGGASIHALRGFWKCGPVCFSGNRDMVANTGYGIGTS